MSDEQLNKRVLTTTTNTKQFTRALVNLYCYGQPDLVNYPVMRERIRSIFRNITSTPIATIPFRAFVMTFKLSSW